MKKNIWLLVFFAVLLADLIGIQGRNEGIQYFAKPLIVPALAAYFISCAGTVSSRLKRWILAALFFSWAGDVLLMFVPKNEIFFLAGLVSFLLAHIFYIIFFHRVRVLENIKGKLLLLLVVVAYYAILITILLPYLGDMKVPVLVYGLVISFMLMLAMHMVFITDKKAGKWMMAGALLFVLSDSILAFNKFYKPFELAGILIMLTYGLAQLLIVKGAAGYINSKDKQ